MFLKLVNPTSGQQLTFQCASEVYFEPVGELTAAEQQAKMDFQEDLGNEPRRFAVWPSDHGEETKIEMTEIIMPAACGKRAAALVILTNYDAWLCNDQGRSIDRIHRSLFTKA